MAFFEEKNILENYLLRNNLKLSEQRIEILEIFLKGKRHFTADELYRTVKNSFSTIGHATIYRTLKIFCECGICRELRLEDGITRYEALYGQKHHDHLICIKCGIFIEVTNSKIEKIQEKIAKSNNFILQSHRLVMYGICSSCNKKKQK